MGVKRGLPHWRKNTDFGALKNRVLRKIFRPQRENLTGHCRKCHNEECHNLLCSPNIIRVIKSDMRWAGHVARMKYSRSTYPVLIHEGMGPLGRHRRRWDNDIIKELQSSGKAWTGLFWHWDRAATCPSGSPMTMEQRTRLFYKVQEI